MSNRWWPRLLRGSRKAWEAQLEEVVSSVASSDTTNPWEVTAGRESGEVVLAEAWVTDVLHLDLGRYRRIDEAGGDVVCRSEDDVRAALLAAGAHPVAAERSARSLWKALGDEVERVETGS